MRHTLVPLQGSDGIRPAFIHVLILGELWAHCIDLPADFGVTDGRSVVLSLTPDGALLDAANADTDRIAVLDAGTGERRSELSLSRVGPIEQVGRSTRPLDQVRTEFTCAC